VDVQEVRSRLHPFWADLQLAVQPANHASLQHQTLHRSTLTFLSSPPKGAVSRPTSTLDYPKTSTVLEWILYSSSSRGSSWVSSSLKSESCYQRWQVLFQTRLLDLWICLLVVILRVGAWNGELKESINIRIWRRVTGNTIFSIMRKMQHRYITTKPVIAEHTTRQYPQMTPTAK
jgi:hypothetical protein